MKRLAALFRRRSADTYDEWQTDDRLRDMSRLAYLNARLPSLFRERRALKSKLR